MKMEQGVPKRWHIEFIRWGITQKKAYNSFKSNCGMQMSIYDQIAPWNFRISLIFIFGLVTKLFNKNKILLAIMMQAFPKEGHLVCYCLGLSKRQ